MKYHKVDCRNKHEVGDLSIPRIYDALYLSCRKITIIFCDGKISMKRYGYEEGRSLLLTLEDTFRKVEQE